MKPSQAFLALAATLFLAAGVFYFLSAPDESVDINERWLWGQLIGSVLAGSGLITLAVLSASSPAAPPSPNAAEDQAPQ